MAGRSRTLLARRRPAERAAYLIGALLIAVGLAHLIVALRYPRPWLGPLSWRKPVTFGLSFGLTLISVTWVAGYLRLPPRRRALVLGVFAADCALEVTGITVQAWRDVPSHFNTESGFDSVIAFGLAAGGAVLVITLGTLAGYALTGRVDAPPAMRLAVRAGFAFLLAGLAAGAAMIARGEQLIRGEHRLQAAYDTAGYLKWFHAITLHAVLVLPALAWLLARTRRTPETHCRRRDRRVRGDCRRRAGHLPLARLKRGCLAPASQRSYDTGRSGVPGALSGVRRGVFRRVGREEVRNLVADRVELIGVFAAGLLVDRVLGLVEGLAHLIRMLLGQFTRLLRQLLDVVHHSQRSSPVRPRSSMLALAGAAGR